MKNIILSLSTPEWTVLLSIVLSLIILNLNVFFFYVWNGMLCTKYIIVFSLENSFPVYCWSDYEEYYSIIVYSWVNCSSIYSVVWSGIAPEPMARALYLTRQHYRKTVLEVHVTWSLFLCICFVDRCLSLSFFFWPLCCLSFDLRILITLYDLLTLLIWYNDFMRKKS
jgi:hypothetical protein